MLLYPKYILLSENCGGGRCLVIGPCKTNLLDIEGQWVSVRWFGWVKLQDKRGLSDGMGISEG